MNDKIRALADMWERQADDPAFPDEDERPIIEAEDAMCRLHAKQLRELLPPSGAGEGDKPGDYLFWTDGIPHRILSVNDDSPEWFIAETIHGGRVVLRALPEAWAYDFTTADGTYIKAANVKRWMQFPDSEYKPLGTATPPAAPATNSSVVSSKLTDATAAPAVGDEELTQWGRKALDRCVRELRGLIEQADDLLLDEMTIAALETAIESMQLRKDITPRGPGGRESIKDAERYNWLRCGGWEVMQDPAMWPEHLRFDGAIDAGMALSVLQAASGGEVES